MEAQPNYRFEIGQKVVSKPPHYRRAWGEVIARHPGTPIPSYTVRFDDGCVDLVEEALDSLREERTAEETRRVDERAAEEIRRVEGRAAEMTRQAEERAAEEIRRVEGRAAEMTRQVEGRAAEMTRQVEERAAEEARRSEATGRG